MIGLRIPTEEEERGGNQVGRWKGLRQGELGVSRLFYGPGKVFCYGPIFQSIFFCAYVEE